MATFEIVVGHELVEVALNLLDGQIEVLPALHPEALIEQGPVHALDEAVGAQAPDLGVAVLDVLDGEQELIGMRLRLAAALPAVVGQDGLHRHVDGVVEGQHPLVEQVAGRHRHLRAVALGKGQRAEGIDHHLDIDLADALQGAPVEGVLIEQFAGRRGLDMPAAEVRAVAIEQQDLGVGEDESGVLPGFPLQAHQALVAGLQVVAQPDAAHARGRDFDAGQPQVVGDALGAVGRPGQAMGQPPFLDLRGDPVRVGAAALFDQGGDAPRLEGPTDLVEGVAVVAHDLAGTGNIAEFVGQLQQGQLAFGTLG